MRPRVSVWRQVVAHVTSSLSFRVFPLIPPSPPCSSAVAAGRAGARHAAAGAGAVGTRRRAGVVPAAWMHVCVCVCARSGGWVCCHRTCSVAAPPHVHTTRQGRMLIRLHMLLDKEGDDTYSYPRGGVLL